MAYTNAKYDNSENTTISVLQDGKHLAVTVDKKNRHYAEMMEQKVVGVGYLRATPDRQASWLKTN